MWLQRINTIMKLRKVPVPAMLHLSVPGDQTIHAQIAEDVSLIAELYFAARWPDLTDVSLVFSNLAYSIRCNEVED